MSELVDKSVLYLNQIPYSKDSYLNDKELEYLGKALHAHDSYFGYYKHEEDIIHIGQCLVIVKLCKNERNEIIVPGFCVLSKIFTATVYKLTENENSHYNMLEQQTGINFSRSDFLHAIEKQREYEMHNNIDDDRNMATVKEHNYAKDAGTSSGTNAHTQSSTGNTNQKPNPGTSSSTINTEESTSIGAGNNKESKEVPEQTIIEETPPTTARSLVLRTARYHS